MRLRLSAELEAEVSYLEPYRGVRLIAREEMGERVRRFERSYYCEEIIQWHKARSAFVGSTRFYLLPKRNLQRMLAELRMHLARPED